MNGGKKLPTWVSQLFVTSDFPMMLLTPKGRFLLVVVPVDGGRSVTCNLSSASVRLLTLVMTTVGKVYWGGCHFRSNSNATSTEAESGGNAPLLILWLKTSMRGAGRNV